MKNFEVGDLWRFTYKGSYFDFIIISKKDRNNKIKLKEAYNIFKIKSNNKYSLVNKLDWIVIASENKKYFKCITK